MCCALAYIELLSGQFNDSLVHRPPPILPFICVHNNAQKQKNRLGLTLTWLLL